MRKTLEQLQASLERLLEKREQLISMLHNNEIDVRATRAAIKRKLRNIERDHIVASVAAARDAPLANITATAMRDAPPPADDLTIPDFLKRDAAVKAEIVQEQAERKRTKAQVRIEKMKAKQSGDTRKVPLTGKDALRFIREGK